VCQGGCFVVWLAADYLLSAVCQGASMQTRKDKRKGLPFGKPPE
jgi:hypothetical protein